MLPGTVVEVPGWFRISLTANDEIGQGVFGGSVALSSDGVTAAIGGPLLPRTSV